MLGHQVRPALGQRAEITDADAKAMLNLAIKLAKRLLDWLAERRPDLVPEHPPAR